MSSLFRKIANAFVIPERLNDSWAYHQYLRWRFPEHWKTLQADLYFYQRIVSTVGNELVFDVGANAGHRAVIFAAIAKRVICLEPDPTSVETLRVRFSNRKRIEIVAKGVADREGELEFKQFSDGCALNTFSDKWVENRETSLGLSALRSIKVPITTLDQLIDQYGQPNLIKIDVEGFELQVLHGLSIPVPYITFECMLPTFEQETLQCIAHLMNLAPQYRFNWTGDDGTSWGEAGWLNAESIRKIVRSNQSGYLEIHCSQQFSEISQPQEKCSDS